MVLEPLNVATTIYIDETLARALDMYDTRTTPKALANYETLRRARLPKTQFRAEDGQAVRFLVTLAFDLDPPDDRKVSFAERAESAAQAATPWDPSVALAVLMQMGWGNERVDMMGGSVREVGEQMQALLRSQAVDVAMRLLSAWEEAGMVWRVDGRAAS